MRAGDKSAREKVILHNMRVVVRLAYKYRDRGLDLEDLIQAGTMGLIRAVDKFNPKMGAKFTTYAHSYVCGYLKNAVQLVPMIRIPSKVLAKLGRLSQIQMDLAQKLGRWPTTEEISSSLNMPTGEIAQVFRCQQYPVSLSYSDEETTLLEVADEQESIENKVCRTLSLQELIDKGRSQLSRMQVELLRFRYVEDKDLATIGRQVGRTTDYVWRHLGSAVATLKEVSTMSNIDPISGDDLDQLTDYDYYDLITGVTSPDPVPVQAAQQTEPYRGQCGICSYKETEGRRQYCKASGWTIGTPQALSHCLYQPKPE